MKIDKLSILLFAVVFAVLTSCNNNDDDDAPILESRDPVQEALTDDEEILMFLRTHFYNYEEFQNPPANFNFEIVIDTIDGDNSDRTPLIDQVTSRTVIASLAGVNNEIEEVPHTLYFLEAREGVGLNPTIADSVVVTFNGQLLNRNRFDSTRTPVQFDLTTLVQGFSEAATEFRGGSGVIIENGDGTVEVEGAGSGLVIMPSGLGFFNVPTPNIPTFSPIIFTMRIFSVTRADHDQDGILSNLEDVDGNRILNDDTDNNGIPNFLDPDDDGDGTFTINEFDENNDGIPDDTDGDGIPDYLDNNDDR